MSKDTFLLGTAIKITTVVSLTGANSVKITIKDSTDTAKITSADMTADTGTVYHYYYQSASTDNEGEYEVTISAVYGNYTAVSQARFTLEEQ